MDHAHAQTKAVKCVQLLAYFIFGLLLNSVGIVILQMVNSYGVAKPAASTLEGFKDIPLALLSFLIAPYTVALGYKTAVVAGLAAACAACAAMLAFPSFATAKVFFVATGGGFALVKVSVYSSVGLMTTGEQEHAAFVNLVEGAFMLGVLAGYFVFGAFIDAAHPGAWVHVYRYLVAACTAATLAALLTPFHAVQAAANAYQAQEAALRSPLVGANGAGNRSPGVVPGEGAAADPPARPGRTTAREEFTAMLQLLRRPAVQLFVAAAFVYVLVEQGVGTWLPMFNREVLGLPTDVSVEVTSIFAAGLACGRLGAGALLRVVRWDALLHVCLFGAAAVVAAAVHMAGAPAAPTASRTEIPARAVLLPAVGLFLAPVYPALVSVVLSSLPKHQHAHLTGLVTMFSALGGSTGSLITGLAFARFDGGTAVSLAVPALGVLLLLVRAVRAATASNTAPKGRSERLV